MDRGTALNKLRELASSGDLEDAHIEADCVLCDLLMALGFEDVVEAWGKVGKWYA